MKVTHSLVVPGLACLCWGIHAPPLSAQSEPVDTVAAPADTAYAPFFVKRDVTIRIGLGSATYDADPQIPDPEGRTVVHLGISAPLSAAPFLALDFDTFHASRTFRYDHGITFPTYEDETDINFWAFTFGGRLRLPASSPVHAYATAGLALTLTQLRTRGTVAGLNLTSIEETDGGVAPMLGAGIQAFLGKIAIHADYRRFSLRGQYADFELGEVDLGASFLILGVGWRGPIPGLPGA